jgi:hypothetical protein
VPDRADRGRRRGTGDKVTGLLNPKWWLLRQLGDMTLMIFR